MNIKDEHTSRLWTFIMKGEIMDLDDDELIATRVNNKVAIWKEVEEYIEKYYVKKDKIIKFLNKYDKATFIAKVDLQELLEERN